MAIKKLAAMTDKTDMTPLLSILQEHAVPKYFDSVTLADDESYISCMIDGREFLRISPVILGTTAVVDNIMVTTTNGTQQGLRAGYGSGGYTEEVFVCENGLMLIPESQKNNFVSITKTESGGTAIVVYTSSKTSGSHGGSQGITSSEGTYALWAISSEDETPAPYLVCLNNSDSVSGSFRFCPIYTQKGIVKNAWCPIQRQFSDMGTTFEANIGGISYLANRGIIIKDE